MVLARFECQQLSSLSSAAFGRLLYLMGFSYGMQDFRQSSLHSASEVLETEGVDSIVWCGDRLETDNGSFTVLIGHYAKRCFQQGQALPQLLAFKLASEEKDLLSSLSGYVIDLGQRAGDEEDNSSAAASLAWTVNYLLMPDECLLNSCNLSLNKYLELGKFVISVTGVVLILALGGGQCVEGEYKWLRAGATTPIRWFMTPLWRLDRDRNEEACFWDLLPIEEKLNTELFTIQVLPLS